MKFTRWWQAFNNSFLPKAFALWVATAFALSVYSQNNYPDFRKVCAIGIGNDITLNWSPLNDPCGGFQKLYIYGRINNLQPFQLIDSLSTIAATNYTHIGAKAVSTTWNYFLVYKFLCNGDSAYSQTLDIDFDQPGISDIDSVSVDIATGKVQVGWRANPAPDLLSYVVWTNAGTNNTPIDTVNTTLYTDPLADPNTGVKSYTLTALDSCYNQSVIGNVHRTVFLQHTYDTCRNKITLNWSAYVGWSNITGYDINAKINSGNFSVVRNLNALTDTFLGFTPGDTLEFYIRAREGTNGFTSASNKIIIITRARKFSTRNYISYATVADTSTIELKLLADTLSDTRKIYIYRRTGDETFTKLNELVYADSSFLIYTDNTALPNQTSYEYRFINYDQCQKPLDTSNIAKTIHLQIISTPNGNELKWNKYKHWDAGVNRYEVFRGFDFGSGFTWNSEFNLTDSFRLDNTLPEETGIQGTCYYIEAAEGTGNKYGEQSTSKSNTVCVVEDVSIYFPNAFAPLEVNKLFLPVGSNVDYKKSTMLIYSRTGQLVKKIDNIKTGWDGTNLDGELCPDGVYLYLCEVFGLNEKKYNFKGTVHLLR